ncbi:Elongation factor 1-alpha [Babesia sp. Xinjiang]|uniref:Elongation factor 1-alpha n=1 Tax=Babesia sp. Xinjiang TaxID=462227 RepID=UPI000A266334|nr:Elongation factor 1-alpha [Babesia sp. Xinjiang]ORM40048.1 Elongation factor 1-alpha [Babesia sp. Xinjiang]
MATPRRYNEYDSDDSYSESDDDAIGYDDFVVNIHKKSNAARNTVQNKSNISSAGKTATNQQYKGNVANPRGPAQKFTIRENNNNRTTQGHASHNNKHETADSNKHATGQHSGNGNANIPALNVVVCGRVDVGKSTLLGHLLTLLGAVDSRLLRGGDMAWILDQGDDERARGITIDPTKASALIEVPLTDTKNTKSTKQSNQNLKGDIKVTHTRVKIDFIDTPGHHDLITNLVRGAVFAKAALVIVDILDFMKEDINGYFEQHFFLLWMLGVRHFVVCVNKVDRCEGFASFAEAERKVLNLITPYKSSSFVIVVPTAGLKGINLLNREPSWGNGPSVVEALQTIAKQTVIASNDVTNGTYKTDGGFSRPEDSLIPNSQMPTGTVLCHIFDMWEISKSQVGCSCFVEATLRTPCKLIALPSGSTVTCTEISCILPTDEKDTNVPSSDEKNTDEPNLSTLMGRVKLSKIHCVPPLDFVDTMTLRDQEIQTLTGDRLLVDKYTFERLKAGTGIMSETSRIICQVYVSPQARHKLTLGFDVEVFVTCFQAAGAITALWQLVSAGKWKRVTSLSPCKEGVVVVQLTTSLLVHPVPPKIIKSVSPLSAPHKPHTDTSKATDNDACMPMPLLSRVLFKVAGYVVAGGTIVVDTPQ